MQWSFSRKSSRSSAARVISRVPRVQSSHPLLPIMRNKKSIHTSYLVPRRSILILRCRLRLGLPSSYFSSGFRNKLCIYFMSPMPATCTTCLFTLRFGEVYKSWGSPLTLLVSRTISKAIPSPTVRYKCRWISKSHPVRASRARYLVTPLNYNAALYSRSEHTLWHCTADLNTLL